ncbi:uncharacterized protein [Antedon mediterranea]|uniref:uncharacterized protein isoform X2 n=1 Tax=Antedon mediterranea TaxID=105859 RepID=UPI003AF507AC
MALRYLVLVVFNIVLWNHVHTLNPNGKNVCTTLVSSSEAYSTSQSYSSSYTTYTKCGAFGWDRCRRTRYRKAYRSVTRYRTVYSNTCHCCSGYSSLPGINECTGRTCSLRSDSKSCYPGTCGLIGDDTYKCYCDFEFDDKDNCMNITVPPKVTNCSISLQCNGISSIDLPCVYSTASHTYSYSSVDGNAFSIKWQTSFSGPSSDEYPFPYYIYDYRVGITSSSFYWKHIREDKAVGSGNINCGGNIGLDNPKQGLYSCDAFENLNEQLRHGDSLILTADSTNGGYLHLKNFSLTGDLTEREYYEGKSITMYVNVMVDIEPPTHCSVTRNVPCVGNALDIGDPYTRMNEVNISWTAWTDYISGLTAQPYKCRVFKMAAKNDILIPKDDFGPLNYIQRNGEYRVTFKLTSTGVYCVILTVDDVAGNTRNARRCFIYDNQSVISIIDDNPIYLTVGEDSIIDNSTLSVFKNEAVTLSWKGHFINKLHMNESLLLAIKTDDDVTLDYDSEAHPSGRPVSAINNINGIIKFEFGLLKDDTEGETLLKPDWKDITKLKDIVDIYFKDEEESGTYQIWIRATDVIGNTKTDFVLVHIDVMENQPWLHFIYVGAGVLLFILAATVCLITVICRHKKQRGRKHVCDLADNPNMPSEKGLSNTYIQTGHETSFIKRTIIGQTDEDVYQDVDDGCAGIDEDIYETILHPDKTPNNQDTLYLVPMEDNSCKSSKSPEENECCPGGIYDDEYEDMSSSQNNRLVRDGSYEVSKMSEKDDCSPGVDDDEYEDISASKGNRLIRLKDGSYQVSKMSEKDDCSPGVYDDEYEDISPSQDNIYVIPKA